MMSFSNGFCLSVIHNNQIQREFNDGGVRTVKLPFGSEYKLRLKNNSIVSRALAEVTLDGVNIMSGDGKVIIPAGRSIDLERFVDSLTEGRRFKFESLEKAAREGTAQDPTSPENGVIRVRFWAEKNYATHWLLRSPQPISGANYDSSTTFLCAVNSGASSDRGCTVEGSHSTQTFVQGSYFETEPSYTEIVIRLRGMDPVQPTCWEIGGTFGQPLRVWYKGQELHGIKGVVSHADGRVLLEIDPKQLAVQR